VVRKPGAHDPGIHCDELFSLPKVMLSRYGGRLNDSKVRN
jgi:hypothetical protein